MKESWKEFLRHWRNNVFQAILTFVMLLLLAGWAKKNTTLDNAASKDYVNEKYNLERTERIKADEEIKTDVKEKDMKTNEKIDFIYRETYKKAMGTYPKD